MNIQLEAMTMNMKDYERQRRREPESNKCNHEAEIGQLETILKVREREYHNLLKVQQASNSAKEKEVQALSQTLKNLRTKIETAKTKHLTSQLNTVGFEKFNDLESRLKESERKHLEL